MAAGCQAAFVARPGMVLSPLGDPPDITGPDLAAVAEQIITIDG
jgi:2-haloacid dehalogenase